MMLQKLQQWQRDRGVNDTALAERIGVTQSAISRAKRGLRVLGMEHQLAIQEVTENAVLPVDWAEFYALTVHLRPKKVPTAQKKSPVSGAVEGVL
jgi:transcriptional regulator with XRE-family HTH domain